MYSFFDEVVGGEVAAAETAEVEREVTEVTEVTDRVS